MINNYGNYGFELKLAEIHKIESILIIDLKERPSEELAGALGRRWSANYSVIGRMWVPRQKVSTNNKLNECSQD
jgi:hypothetical protein